MESSQRSILESPGIYSYAYGQIFKGYFYAPVSENYIFRGAVYDKFSLSMSLDYGSLNSTL